MVEIAHLLRSDRSFVVDFDRRMDELLGEHNLCARKENGFLGSIAPDSPPDAIDRVSGEIIRTIVSDGFVDQAVESLNRQGIEAKRNCIDFIAVNPDSLSN